MCKHQFFVSQSWFDKITAAVEDSSSFKIAFWCTTSVLLLVMCVASVDWLARCMNYNVCVCTSNSWFYLIGCKPQCLILPQKISQYTQTIKLHFMSIFGLKSSFLAFHECTKLWVISLIRKHTKANYQAWNCSQLIPHIIIRSAIQVHFLIVKLVFLMIFSCF